MASTPEVVRIRYRRPPDREDIYEQFLVSRTPGCVVTLLPRANVAQPSVLDGHVIIEPGSPIVWFAFPGKWYDVGRFHTADGAFRGFYSDIVEPITSIETLAWTMTDLCLDVWVDTLGKVRVLDEDELEQAIVAGWIEPPLARRAQEEAAAIVERAARGDWPPAIVREWPLERALEVLGYG